jgi:DNA-binding LacI/PurR family transcriptional regulator
MSRAHIELSAAETIVQMAQRLPAHQTKLPGLRKLSRQLGFSVAQVRTAIGHLSRLGVLKSVHGAGTFYLGEQIPQSRLATLESAALMPSRKRSAPVFHVLCVPQFITSPLHSQMLVAIVNAFARRNEVVQIDTVPYGEWEEWVLKRRKLRGLLVAEFATPALGKVLDRRRVPWVVFNRLPEGVSAHSVVLDDAGLVAASLEHLRGLGHRGVGFAFPQEASPSSCLRREAFAQKCRELGMRGQLQPQPEEGAASIHRLVESGCTAIACNNDHLALRVMREAQRLGIDVPGQLSVCGIDNVPEGIAHRPSLTTVHYSLPMMGEWAVKMLLSLKARVPRHKQRWVVPSEVLARGSSAPPPRAARAPPRAAAVEARAP